MSARIEIVSVVLWSNLPPVHPDFFTTAATLTPLLLFGAVWAQRSTSGHLARGRRVAILATQVLPASVVLYVSLLILGGFTDETASWRSLVMLLLASQGLSGLIGTAMQALHREAEGATERDHPSAKPVGRRRPSRAGEPYAPRIDRR
jgi:hypothetical protein